MSSQCTANPLGECVSYQFIISACHKIPIVPKTCGVDLYQKKSQRLVKHCIQTCVELCYHGIIVDLVVIRDDLSNYEIEHFTDMTSTI